MISLQFFLLVNNLRTERIMSFLLKQNDFNDITLELNNASNSMSNSSTSNSTTSSSDREIEENQLNFQKTQQKEKNLRGILSALINGSNINKILKREAKNEDENLIGEHPKNLSAPNKQERDGSQERNGSSKNTSPKVRNTLR